MPGNKLERCECGGKIVSAIDEHDRKKYIKICCNCNIIYGEVKKIYSDSQYNTYKKKRDRNDVN